MVSEAGHRIALVLGGGNALGAYQAGVYQALHAAGIVPDRIVGTSAGAINGALIAGNAPEDRLARLADYWRPGSPERGDGWSDSWRRTSDALATLLAGRSGLFAPIGSALFGDGAPALYDTAPMARTLARSIDLGRLNHGPIRYAATAVVLETGADAVFDTAERPIGIDHIRASAALPPAFPPVAIGGVLHVDGGVSANLPLDALLAEPGDAPLLCLAIDLLPVQGPPPRTLGMMAERMQDLLFANQSRRSIARWQERYATDPAFAGRAVALVHLTYADQGPEVAGKAMDFSATSARRRWDCGLRDGSAFLHRLRDRPIPIGAPGLTLVPLPDLARLEQAA